MSGRALSFVDPAHARIARTPDGLRLEHDGVTTTGLSARAAYPWSAPGEFVALLDRADETVAMVEQVSQLDAASRQALEDELAERRFLPVIRGIVALTFKRNLYIWEVETDRGPRTFRTNHGWEDEPVRRLEAGTVLITATDGVRYRLADPATLSPRELDLLKTIL